MTDQQRDSLVQAASTVRTNAYAPYSVYKVGAAVLGADGGIYVGCNVENVSFGLTVCAERTAIGTMVANGCKRIVAAAVVTEEGATPCGMCRQTFAEFADDATKVEIITASETGDRKSYWLADLIPDSFRTELKVD